MFADKSRYKLVEIKKHQVTGVFRDNKHIFSVYSTNQVLFDLNCTKPYYQPNIFPRHPDVNKIHIAPKGVVFRQLKEFQEEYKNNRNGFFFVDIYGYDHYFINGKEIDPFSVSFEYRADLSGNQLRYWYQFGILKIFLPPDFEKKRLNQRRTSEKGAYNEVLALNGLPGIRPN